MSTSIPSYSLPTTVKLTSKPFTNHFIRGKTMKLELTNIAKKKTLSSNNQCQNRSNKAAAKVEFNLELSDYDLHKLNNLLPSTDREDLMDFGDDTNNLSERNKKNMVQSGDLWLLGRHKLLCSNGMNSKAIDYLLEEDSVEMVFTDPPCLDYINACDNKISNDYFSKELYQFLSSICKNILRVCNGAVYICIDSPESHILRKAFVEAGGHWPTFVIWIKHHLSAGITDYHCQYENILYGWKEGNKRHWWNDGEKSDVWIVDEPSASEALMLFGEPSSDDLYPTIKPRDLAYRAIINSSKARDIVFDPFAGCGSTLIACESLNRCARLIESNPERCEIMIKRWEMSIVKKAILLERGVSFK